MGVMETIAKAVIQIGADTSGLDKSLSGMSGKVDKAFGAVKTIVTGAAAYAVARWTLATTALGVEAERSAAIFTNTMKTAAHAPDAVIEKLKDWASSQELVAGFDAEELMNELGTLAMKTGDAAQAQSQLEAAMNLARGRGMALAEASNMVSMATLGMTRTWKQLGLELETGASKATIMSEINKKVAGAAAAFVQTSAGQLSVLKVTYESMRENLGTTLLPIVNSFATAMLPIIQKITTFVADNKEAIATMVANIAEKIGILVGKLLELDLEKILSTIGKIAGAAGLLFLVSSMVKVGDALAQLTIALEILSKSKAFLWLVGIGGAATVAGIAAVAYVANKVPQDTANAYDYRYGKGVIGSSSGTEDRYKTVAGRTETRGTIVMGGRGTIVNQTGVLPYIPEPELTAEQIKAAKEAAEKIAQLNQELKDKLYTLTHSELEDKLHAIDVEARAMKAEGRDAVLIASYVKEAKARIYQEDSDNRAKAAKEAADETARIESEQLAKMEEAFQAANQTLIENSNAAFDAMIQAQKDVASAEENVKYGLMQFLKDQYSKEYELKKKDLDKGVEAVRKATDKEKKYINDRYDEEIDRIETAALAKLAPINSAIAALRASREAAKAQEEEKGLLEAINTAETPEAAAKATKEYQDWLSEQTYQKEIARLQSQAETVRSEADAEKDVAKNKYAAETKAAEQWLADQEAIYNTDLENLTTYYNDKVLARNLDAEAEKTLAINTNSQILEMLRGKLGEWRALGAEINDAMFGNVEETIARLEAAMTNNNMYAAAGYQNGGGGGVAIKAYGSGGWAGLNGPEIAIVGEHGPEKIIPSDSVADESRSSKELIAEIRALRADVVNMGRAFALGVQGMGRSI